MILWVLMSLCLPRACAALRGRIGAASGADGELPGPVKLQYKALTDRTTLGLHTFVGTGEMRMNPERGFRHEIHGACTGEGDKGISDTDIQQLAQFNLTVAQVYCYLPTNSNLDAQDLNAISAALVCEKIQEKMFLGIIYISHELFH